jgi:peptide chain release factor 1
MLEQLEKIEQRFAELNALLIDPVIAQDYSRVAEYAKERAELEGIMDAYRAYREAADELADTQELLAEDIDPELRELAEAETASLSQQLSGLEADIRQMLLPRDPRDDRDVIVEIRAGAGGDEAGIFAANLFRMITRYSERQGWSTELLNENATGVGGFKEVIFNVRGRGAFSRLKFESGVHRVQRVPKTEASGRIHTSTATVAVLPEADDVEIHIDPKDLEIEAYGASGPGGQHMQKNATAIRILHKPTGLIVSCENQRSQTQNKTRALAILRARLYEQEVQRQTAEVAQERRAQVGTGERSEKIRTYNFPQNRVTDHRIGLTIHRLPDVLDGDLDPLIEQLTLDEQARRLQAMSGATGAE